jgi:hypothetical protein
MRSNLAPYSTALSQLGGAFYDQFAGAQARGAPQQGLQGVYGTADQLTGLVNQGPGPSLAQAQLQANTAQAMRQQLAMAGSGRGAGGGASAYRNAAAQQAMIQGQGNAQAAMLQAQEANDWRNYQANALAQAAGMYGQGAGIEQQQTGLNDAYGQNMASLAAGAQQGAAVIQQGVESGVNAIQTNALQGRTNYENNLTNIYGITKGVPVSSGGGINWLDVGLTTGGAVAGGLTGGPAGAAAGAVVGHGVGSNFA